MNNYHLYEEIGSGCFSVLYKGRKRYGLQYVSIKSEKKKERQKVANEVRSMDMFSSQKSGNWHRNVVEFFEFHETRNHLWEILEYCCGGDLARLLKDDKYLPEDQVLHFAKDLSEGLCYIHSHGFLHCDIKPSNLVFDENGVLKLSDFGLSRQYDAKDGQIEGIPIDCSTLRGSPYYMAAELFYVPPIFSRQSDLWSMGVVIYELAVGKPPWSQASFKDLVSSLLRDPAPPVPDFTKDFDDLVSRLLHKDRQERCDWPQVHEHPWWKDQSFTSMRRQQPPQEHLKKVKTKPVVGNISRMGAIAQKRLLDEMESAGEQKPPVWEDDFKPKSFDMELNFTEFEKRGAANKINEKEKDKESKPRTARDTKDEERSEKGSRVNSNATLPPCDTRGMGNREQKPAEGQLSALPAKLILEKIPESVMSMLSQIDTAVKPISNNPLVEKPEVLSGDLHNLPFQAMNLEDVFNCTNQVLEEFLTKVYKSIAQGSLEVKITTLIYLEQLCGHLQVADLVANSSLLRLVLKMIRVRSPELRLRLWSLIGQLLRHSTFLEPNIQSLGIFDELMLALQAPREEQAEIQPRRKAAAALGELLFYVATAPASKDNTQWRVPQSTIAGVVKHLCNADEDVVVLHYLAKSVENVATQSQAIAHKWYLSSSYELSRAFLSYVLNRNDRADNGSRDMKDYFRVTCLGALAMLSRIAHTNVIAALSHKTENRSVDLTVIRWGLFGELAPQGTYSAFMLLLTILEHAKDVMIDEELVHGILHLSIPRAQASHSHTVSVILRCKAILFVSVIAQFDSHWFSLCLTNGLGQSLDKLARENDKNAQQTVAAVTDVVSNIMPEFLHDLIDQLDTLPESAIPRFLDKLYVPVHLLSSGALRSCLMMPSILPLLGTLVSKSPPPTHPRVQRQLLLMAETLSGQSQPLFDAPADELLLFVEGLVTALLGCDDNESLFVGLKVFTDLYVGMINEGIDGLNEVFLQALPVFPRLLTANDPLPSWTLKLLSSYLHSEKNNKKVLERIKDPLMTALAMPLTTYSARVGAGMLQGNLGFDVTPMIQQLRRTLEMHTQETDDESHIAMDTHLLDGALCLLEAALQAKVNIVECIGPLIGVLPPLTPIAFHLCDRALSLCEEATQVLEPVSFSQANSQSLLVVLDATSLPKLSSPQVAAGARKKAITIIRWTNSFEPNETLIRGLNVLVRNQSSAWDQAAISLAKRCLQHAAWQK